MLCRACGDQSVLNADMFMGMVTITKHGEDDSNDRHMSEEVAQNFESYVYDCEGIQIHLNCVTKLYYV